jgi:5-methylcytosine-specific restriction endonuclease McrA
MGAKVALQAASWYNEVLNNVMSGGAANTPDRTHLLRRCIMDTLSPLAQDGNTPQKYCSTCERFYPATTEYFYSRHKGGLRSSCRSCYNARGAVYKDDHRVQRSESAKRYHLARKEEINAARKLYYQDHKDEYRERHAQYYQANCNEILANNKRYSQTQAGRASSVARSHKRRARERDIPGSFTPQEFAEQVKRQKNKCYWCHKRLTEVQADHVIPVSRPGATNYISNIVAACPTCNKSRSNKLPHEWIEGGRLL